MSNRFSKILITTLSFIAAFTVIFICHKGFVSSNTVEEKFFFSEAVLRSLFSFVFLLVYHFSLSPAVGTQSRFLSLYLLFSILSELRIITPASSVSNLVFIEPSLSIYIVLFSTYMMFFCLAGYGLYYSTNEASAMTRFMLLSASGSLLITAFSPKVMDTVAIWTLLPEKTMIIILFIAIVITFIIQLVSDAPGSYRVRHIAGLILSVGNIMNLMFNTFIMNLTATILTLLGLTIILLIAKRGDAKL